MKKIILYTIVALIAFKLIGNLWKKITLDEEEEVQKFTQKIEILKTSTDYSDVSFTSYQYLTFLEENIDWFTAEQSKSISSDLNYLRDYAKSKIDSIDNARAANKEEEKKRIKLEEAKKQELDRDAKEKEKRDKELAWMRKYWHVGKWELSVEDLKLILDLKQNGKCNVYLINRWVNDLSYEKTTNKISISPINDVNLEFNVDNNKRKIYSSDYTPLTKL
jgi:hypothetical protein